MCENVAVSKLMYSRNMSAGWLDTGMVSQMKKGGQKEAVKCYQIINNFKITTAANSALRLKSACYKSVNGYAFT